MIVNRLNEAVSHYTDMNIKDDKIYSLKVSDTQMLVTTKKEQDLPICDFNYILVYDKKQTSFIM